MVLSHLFALLDGRIVSIFNVKVDFTGESQITIVILNSTAKSYWYITDSGTSLHSTLFCQNRHREKLRVNIDFRK